MTGFERIKSLIMGLLMTIMGVILMAIRSDESLLFVALFFCVSCIVTGIRYLAFYFQMSRHMIGGINHLIAGIVLIDIGLAASMVSGKPNMYIALYLAALNFFSGAILVYRAVNFKKMGESHWKLKFARGVIDILIAVGCIIFMKSDEYLMAIYSFGLIVSGVMSIIETFRPTDVIYIQ